MVEFMVVELFGIKFIGKKIYFTSMIAIRLVGLSV